MAILNRSIPNKKVRTMPTTVKPGRVKDRDFTMASDQHKRLADFVNKKSGLAPLDPTHIKAVLALKTDFDMSAAEVKRREKTRAAREAAREQVAAQYEGMNDNQIKAVKRAARAAAKAEQAKADADRLLKR